MLNYISDRHYSTSADYQKPFLLQVILGALPLAVETVNNDSSLLPGKTLRYIAHDIGIGLPMSSAAIK